MNNLSVYLMFSRRLDDSVTVLNCVTPCRFIGRYQRFGETKDLSPEDGNSISPKRWYVPTSLHGVTTQITSSTPLSAYYTWHPVSSKLYPPQLPIRFPRKSMSLKLCTIPISIHQPWARRRSRSTVHRETILGGPPVLQARG
jgi:hypothetical protein